MSLLYAARALRSSPAFTIAAIATLALGIGANTAIFQLLDAVRLRKLRVPQPDQLAMIQIANGQGFGVTDGPGTLTFAQFQAIRENQQAFSSIFAWENEYGSERIGEGAAARKAPVLNVSGEFFSTLEISPALGRLFSTEDDVRGCASPTVVLGYDFWKSEFGGQRSAIGSRLIVQNRPLEIIGVAPEEFTGPEVGLKFDLALPLCARAVLHADTTSFDRRDLSWLNVMGRLKPGWTVARASAQLGSSSAEVMKATLPSGYSRKALDLYLTFLLKAEPGATGISRLGQEYDRSLWLLLGLSGLVLLLACVNLSNLMLARMSAREREFAVRRALGAGTWRLILQCLTESALLTSAGAAMGFFVAAVLSRGILYFLDIGDNPLHLDLSLDWRILVFTGGVTSATCILVGLAPAWRASRTQPVEFLKSGGRSSTIDRGGFGFQRLLVVAQISISLVLVAGAFLFVSSLWRIVRMDAGFHAQGVLLSDFDAPKQAPLLRELLEIVRATPGVNSAAVTTNFLIGGGSWTLGVRTPGLDQDVMFTWVGPKYFETLQTRIIKGRDFDSSDSEKSPKVAIVDEKLARRFFPGKDPIGMTFRTSPEPNYPEAGYEIVGLVRNSRYLSLKDIGGPEPPMVYGSASQYPPGFAGNQIYIRTSAPLYIVEAAVRKRIGEWRPGMGMSFRPFERQLSNSLMRERLLAALAGFFGALAGLIAAVGLYGVMAYNTARRRNEFGIRLALGATSGQIVSIILRQAALLVMAGLAIGLVIFVGAAGLASSLVFGISPRNPWVIGAAVTALGGVAAIGSFIPALKASRLDPLSALRDD